MGWLVGGTAVATGDRGQLGLRPTVDPAFIQAQLTATAEAKWAAYLSSGNAPRVAATPAAASDIASLCPDDFEPDNTAAEAKPIPANGTSQTHTFDLPGDVDWISFNALRGGDYVITTSNLVLDTDTVLELYDTDGQTFLAGNDDYPGSDQPFASRIIWNAPRDGRYYVLIREFFGRGDCLGYDVDVRLTGAAFRALVPVIEHERGTAEPTATPTATATPTPTRTPTATPTPKPTPIVDRLEVPGLLAPNGLAVDPTTNTVYVVSRDNDQVIVLDGGTGTVIDTVPVGDEPFGVALNKVTGKLYVSNFRSGELTVVDAMSLEVIREVYMGPELTFVAVNTVTNRVYVVSHGLNSLLVIDGETDALNKVVATGDPGIGSFGVAVNETLNRVYVSNRDTHNIATLDGDGQLLSGQQVVVEPSKASPYQLGFNPNTNKLYAMLAPSGDVDRVQVYQASAYGLTRLGDVRVESGGADAGAGVAVNTVTNHVFVTNTQSNSVAVIEGIGADRLLTHVRVGEGPFGIAANPLNGRVFAGNRASNDLSMIVDNF